MSTHTLGDLRVWFLGGPSLSKPYSVSAVLSDFPEGGLVQICFPQGRVWGQGRRLQQLGAVGPNGNHGYPSGCPQNQVP